MYRASVLGGMISRMSAAIGPLDRGCEPAKLPQPVAERNEPDAPRKSAPDIRNNPRPLPRAVFLTSAPAA